jgi:hypothetical protein
VVDARHDRAAREIVQIVMVATMVFAFLDLYLLASSLLHH